MRNVLSVVVCFLLILSCSPVHAGAESGAALPQETSEAKGSGISFTIPAEEGAGIHFVTEDLSGNPVSSEELFGGHSVTMINLWATWCDPCIGELPELEKISREIAADGFRIIGIVTDTDSETKIEKALRILEEKGVTYVNLKAFEGLSGMLPQQFWPTSYFVDETGALIGEPIESAEPEKYRERFAGLRKNNGLQAYIIHVTDQDNRPVEEVIVNFCTDTACTPVESDENGLIVFAGAPDIYHVQIVDVPEGYSCDEDFELYTAAEYGEWTLRLTKD